MNHSANVRDAATRLRVLTHTAPFDRASDTFESIVQDAINADRLALLAEVERDHCRTTKDTGANPNARVILNTFRRLMGLPYMSTNDLPSFDAAKVGYVMPADSVLLANRPM